MVRSGRRTARRLAYDCSPDFRVAKRSTTSRLPTPRKAAMAARFLPLGRALPCSQAYTLCPDAPTSNPKSAADKPRRLRLLVKPEARNRRLSAVAVSSAGVDAGTGVSPVWSCPHRADGWALDSQALVVTSGAGLSNGLACGQADGPPDEP